MSSKVWLQATGPRISYLFQDVYIPTICRTEDGIAVSTIQIHYV